MGNPLTHGNEAKKSPSRSNGRGFLFSEKTDRDSFFSSLRPLQPDEPDVQPISVPEV